MEAFERLRCRPKPHWLLAMSVSYQHRILSYCGSSIWFARNMAFQQTLRLAQHGFFVVVPVSSTQF
jgi:hypothetical protein